MPKKVDQDQRRAELLVAVWQVIARDGMENVTVRTLARETGFSAGTLAHYFADKDDILVSALRLSHEQIAARWEEKLEGLRGLEAFRVLVLDNLPLDDERELETRLAMNYWVRAVTHEHVVSSQWRKGPPLFSRLTDLAAEGQELGQIVRDEEPEAIAERFHALIDGLSLHSLLYADRLSRDRQVELMEVEFRRLEISDGTTAIGRENTMEERDA
ncbi:MAG TPA: TetR/AcrR family transcriptional regulator [Solirubrobacterales bacterium]|nr:TetR/AcrR family transcriptional regulator [Solirubrobacterales bacterium]